MPCCKNSASCSCVLVTGTTTGTRIGVNTSGTTGRTVMGPGGVTVTVDTGGVTTTVGVGVGLGVVGVGATTVGVVTTTVGVGVTTVGVGVTTVGVGVTTVGVGVTTVGVGVTTVGVTTTGNGGGTNIATKALPELLLAFESGTMLVATPPTKLLPLVPTGTTIVVLNTPPGISVTGARVCVTPPCPINGVKVVVAKPRLVNVTTPVTVVFAFALEVKVTTVPMSESKETPLLVALLLPGTGSTTVLVPDAVNIKPLMPTGTLMVVV